MRYHERWTPKRIWEQYKDKITEEGILLCDIADLPISTAAKLIEGISTNGKELKSDNNLMPAGESYEVSFESSGNVADTGAIRNQKKEEAVFSNEFEYVLWNTLHTARKMSDMMHDIFDLIAEKYPEKVQDIAVSDSITAVARKSDLDQKTANASKIKQFANFKCKEHFVDGEVYCVNAGYNREACIKQIEKMLILCDGASNVFKLAKAPEKSTHSVSKSGKKGLGELLN